MYVCYVWLIVCVCVCVCVCVLTFLYVCLCVCLCMCVCACESVNLIFGISRLELQEVWEMMRNPREIQLKLKLSAQ